MSIIWLHSAYRSWHKKSITCRYAEHSEVANVTSAGYNGVNAIVIASLLLNVHIMQSNALQMTLNPLIKYICSVNILCTDATVMQFTVQYPSQSAPRYCEFNKFDVTLSVITVCLLVFFKLSGTKESY